MESTGCMRPVCVEFECSPMVRFFFFSLSKNIQTHSCDISVGVSQCLVIDQRPVLSVQHIFANACWDRLQPQNSLENGLMGGWFAFQTACQEIYSFCFFKIVFLEKMCIHSLVEFLKEKINSTCICKLKMKLKSLENPTGNNVAHYVSINCVAFIQTFLVKYKMFFTIFQSLDFILTVGI